VIIAEGALDRSGKKISPNDVKDVLSKQAKLDTRVTTLGHVQRGGTPCAYDRTLATCKWLWPKVHAVLMGVSPSSECYLNEALHGLPRVLHTSVEEVY
jgi:hypothetical protein